MTTHHDNSEPVASNATRNDSTERKRTTKPLAILITLLAAQAWPVAAQSDRCRTHLLCNSTIDDRLEPSCFTGDARTIHPFLDYATPVKYYEFSGIEGEKVKLTATSSAFDPRIALTSPTNKSHILGYSGDGVAVVSEGLGSSGLWTAAVVGGGPDDFGDFTLDFQCGEDQDGDDDDDGDDDGDDDDGDDEPAPSPFVCVENGETLCLGQDGRFEVKVEWRNQFHQMGDARTVALDRQDSGLFYFFNRENIEMLVKVLDGCAVSNRYWVFAAATTNVELTLRVTDSTTGTVREYFNPLGQPAVPIQDTSAFNSCP